MIRVFKPADGIPTKMRTTAMDPSHLAKLLQGIRKQTQPQAKLHEQHEEAGSSSNGAQDEGALSRSGVDEDAEVEQDPDGADCEPA